MANITDIREMKARIVVFGVGGAGGNAVNNMIAAGAPRRGIYRRKYRRTGAHHVEG
jgi:cell division GTPase FtsZ